MSITIKELAAKCGLAPSMVGHILSSEGGRYSQKTRERVHRLAAEHDYYPTHLARAFRQRKAARVGILMRGLFDNYYLEVRDTFVSRGSTTGLDPMVQLSNWQMVDEARHRDTHA